jgi:hypothetical protein
MGEDEMNNEAKDATFDSVEGGESASGNGQSRKAWVSLSRFEVNCQSRQNVVAPVYANGLQQVPIEVVIEARDENGVVVPVDVASLRVSLVDYNNPSVVPDGIIPWAEELPEFVYHWTVQREIPGMDAGDEAGLGMGVAQAHHDTPSARGQVFKKWISMRRIATVKLAAMVTSPAGVVFVSNTPNSAPGKFNSYVIVDGRPPKAIPWTEMSLARVNAFQNDRYDVDLYYVYFTDPNISIVDTVHHPDHPGNGSHYAWKDNDATLYMQACFAMAGGPREVTWTSCIEGVNCKFRINDRPGQAACARVTFSSAHVCTNYRAHGVALGLLDHYGNDSRVGIGPADGGNEIKLVDPNSVSLSFGPEPGLPKPNQQCALG